MLQRKKMKRRDMGRQTDDKTKYLTTKTNKIYKNAYYKCTFRYLSKKKLCLHRCYTALEY